MGNPQRPCNSSRGVYLPDDVDGYNRDNDGNHDRPVGVAIAPAACTSQTMSTGTTTMTTAITIVPSTLLFAIARSSSGSQLTLEDAEAPGIPRRLRCWRRSWHRQRRQVPAASRAPFPPGTSSWDWQVATAWYHCTTHPTLGAMGTCNTIAARTTMTARTTEAQTAMVWRGAVAALAAAGWDMMSEFWGNFGYLHQLSDSVSLITWRRQI